MKYEIVARVFPNQSEAMIYAIDHTCLTVGGSEAKQQSADEWLVFELVPVPKGSE